MTKNKYPLKIFSVVSLVLIALTVIFVSIFGVRTSVEIGGGLQVEVKLTYNNEAGQLISDREIAGDYVSQIKKVLSKHGASVDNFVIEDKNIDTYLVVRIAKSKIKNPDTLKSDIAEMLKIDISRVSDLQSLDSYFSSNIMLYISIAILCVLVVCFFAGWMRYGVLSGVSLMFALLHNIIFSMALIFLTRTQFSLVSLAAVLVSSVLVVFGFTQILERNRENSKSKQYAAHNEDEKLILASKQCKTLVIIPIVALILSFVMVCVPVAYVQLAGVSILLCVISSIYSLLFVTPALHVYINDIKNLRAKQKLSTNNISVKK